MAVLKNFGKFTEKPDLKKKGLYRSWSPENFAKIFRTVIL